MSQMKLVTICFRMIFSQKKTHLIVTTFSMRLATVTNESLSKRRNDSNPTNLLFLNPDFRPRVNLP